MGVYWLLSKFEGNEVTRPFVMEEISEKEGCFRKLSCLEKRKNDLSLQEAHKQ